MLLQRTIFKKLVHGFLNRIGSEHEAYMKIVVQGGNDMTMGLAGFSPPVLCERIVVSAPEARRFTHLFADSPVNCRVEIEPSRGDVTYAGMFSGCTQLNAQPIVNMSNCINAAAMFKNCQSARFNLFELRHTKKVRNMRQCFAGCTSLSGNGLQAWDYSGLVGADAMRNFAGGTNFPSRFYDNILRRWHEQARAGVLPTPMRGVDMGGARYSPAVADDREFLVQYGWDISDGGEVPYTLSALEKEFTRSIDDRLESADFPGDIDLSPVARSARNGILISPKHVLYVRHYQPAVGQSVSFWNGETATVQSCVAGDWDVAVATLAAPVDVRPALVMPADWKAKMPTMYGPPSSYPDGTNPPMLWVNRLNEVGIWDLSYANNNPAVCQGVMPSDPLRARHFRGIGVGDSGSPVCCVYGDRLVAAYPLAMSTGSGVFTGAVYDWLHSVTNGTIESV